MRKMTMGNLDVERERDAVVLIQAARDILDGQRVFGESGLAWSAALLAQTQERLALLERIVRRLRVIATMRLGPDGEEDWGIVEFKVGERSRRERVVRGGG